MAQITEYLVSGSPSLVYNFEANYRRSGNTVIIDWNVQFRFPYTSDYLGTGRGLWVRASANGSSSAIELKSSSDQSNYSYYSDPPGAGAWWPEHTSSFSYTNSSAHTVTVTFSGEDTTGYNQFSTSLQISVPAGESSNKHTWMSMRNTGDRYLEVISHNNFRYASWPPNTGQSGDIWINTGSGSWTRGGETYEWGGGRTYSQYATGKLDEAWATHVYSGDTMKGTFDWYPRIYIKYNANGGSGSISQQTKYLGETKTLANSSSGITRSHYILKAWAAGSASGTQYSLGKSLNYFEWNSISGGYADNLGWHSYIPAHNGNTVTLYAVWQGATYTITYNKNGGTSTPSKQNFVYPNSVKLANSISRNNGSASGYTITYNANGGSGAPSSQTSSSRTITYTFAGWNTNSSGTGTNYNAAGTYSFSDSTTLYAKWNASTTYTSSWTCSNTKPTRTNYTFLGWSTSSTATTATYSAGATYNITGNLALYAVWGAVDNPTYKVLEGQRDRFYIEINTSMTVKGISVRVHNKADGSSTANDIITNFGTSKTGVANAGGPRRHCTVTTTVSYSGGSKTVVQDANTEGYVPGQVLLTHEALDVTPTTVKFTLSGTIDNTDISKGTYNIYIVPKQTAYIADAPTMYFAGVLWQRVLKQNCKQGTINFTSASGARDSGQYTTDEKCSFMSRLNNNLKINSKYQFLLIYPNLYNWQTGYNSWRQTNNPIDEYVNPSSGTTTASGYESVNVSWTAAFGGMTRQNSSADSISSCYLSGNVGSGNFFYALATSQSWIDRYPIPVEPNHGSNSYNGTWGSAELWVRVPGSVTPIIQSVTYDGTTKEVIVTGLDPDTEYMAFAELIDNSDSSKVLNNYSKLVSFKTKKKEAKLRFKTTEPVSKYLLPNTLQQLNYIESTGTQYINTGYYPTKDTSVFVDFEFTDTTTYQQRVFGVQTDNTNEISYSSYINGGGNLAYAYNDGTGNWKSTDVAVTASRMKLFLNDDGFVKVNDAMSYYAPIEGSITKTSPRPMYLMASNNAGSLGRPAKIKIYQFNIFENGKLVRNYVPCYRKSDNVIGMYETQNGAFYTNSGTGTFTRGSNFNIHFYEYLKLGDNDTYTNNSYFNTGYIPNYNTNIIAKIKLIENTHDTMLFGARNSYVPALDLWPHQYTFWTKTSNNTTHPGSAAIFNATSVSVNSYPGNTEIIFSMCCRDNRSNGTVIKWSPDMGSPKVQLPIGALNIDNTIDSRKFIGYIYYFIIYENNELTHYYIPILETVSGFAGFYDIVTRTFTDMYDIMYDEVYIGGNELTEIPMWKQQTVLPKKNNTYSRGTTVYHKVNGEWIEEF